MYHKKNWEFLFQLNLVNNKTKTKIDIIMINLHLVQITYRMGTIYSHKNEILKTLTQVVGSTFPGTSQIIL